MKEVLLPELAESVVEGEILKWMVAEGDSVAAEQPLCEVMTDKVTVELPSPFAGTVARLLVKEGDVVAVHAPILLLDETGGAASSAASGSGVSGGQTPSPEQAIQGTGENPRTEGVQLPPQAEEERSIVEAGHIAKDDDSTSLFKAFETGGAVKVQGLNRGAAAPAQAAQEAGGPAARADGRVLAVPAARQLAREMGIDLKDVRGSGPNGRIRIADVAQHIKAQAPAAAGSAPAGGQGGLPVAPVQYRTPKGYEHLEERVPLRGMRRAISNQMLASHLYTVRTLTVDEINMTRLVQFRDRVKGEAAAAGVKISYLPFIFKAVAAALKKYPSLNTSFDEATQEIVQKRYYNMGMAVATDAGLTVPVLRDVDKKSVYELAREVVDLAARAQEGRLKSDELTGSTFAITNIGSIGALFSFPIINVPDAAILGIHSIQKRPIVNDQDEIEIAHMMYISLSFDHRLVDGAEAARFCKEVIRLLENPDRLMLEAM
ncbi:dihydrolipoamide acetyltransferase component of pyruvate dehydrogenase complex [Deinococcus piscis]|uniref:Dihydrolipoamide acetyltransferase component of pyruvate dehydrogenase complex n=1 Tax=Deinococcus piscis TaxID=394230 RepID=A0ABQ3K347_9DEIO|nr:dihydrolipoamide acetyltransferase family protein [Deinococcus piscis]GHF95564.1 dihydrolipoamide acetyltransferase component of pyruvate dehydrogenase complex [Deinococcus piscis]